MAATRVRQKPKVAYLSNYWVDFDDFYIKLYVFWGAESISEVIDAIRGRDHMVKGKAGAILGRKANIMTWILAIVGHVE